MNRNENNNHNNLYASDNPFHIELSDARRSCAINNKFAQQLIKYYFRERQYNYKYFNV